MPLPLILGIAAAVAGTTGVGLEFKMKQANDKLKEAQKRNDSNNARLERMNQVLVGLWTFWGRMK